MSGNAGMTAFPLHRSILNIEPQHADVCDKNYTSTILAKSVASHTNKVLSGEQRVVNCEVMYLSRHPAILCCVHTGESDASADEKNPAL